MKLKIIYISVMVILFICYPVQIFSQGECDVNNNGVVSLRDLSLVANNYGVSIRDEGFNYQYDINNDGIIDVYDLVYISKKMHGFELHVFYALGSNDQYKKFKEGDTINSIRSVSFGWSKLEYNTDNDDVKLNVLKESNDFYIPEGYEEPMNYFSEQQISTQLNVFMDKPEDKPSYFDKVFQQKGNVISQIVNTVCGIPIEERSLNLDGVVIDFEGLPVNQRNNYIDFLTDLSIELHKNNKKLYVAVQPNGDVYDYAKIIRVADRLILMLHDYNAKKMIPNQYIVDTPLSPINRVRADLDDILNMLREDESEKIWLQINFATAQWITKEGKLIDSNSDGVVKPYTPPYSKVYDRIKAEAGKGRNVNDIIKFHDGYRNPYITFNDDQGNFNTVWYEDNRSVIDKIKLAKEKGLGGISIWRLGNIPNYESEYYLDVWQRIIQELDK